MPTNFFTPDQGPNNVPFGPGADFGSSKNYVAEEISKAAQYVGALGKELAKGRDIKVANEFEAAVAGVDLSTASYYEKQYQYLNQISTATDKATLGEYEAKLNDLVMGREQGVVTPIQAQVQIDNLIKEYSQRVPHLGQAFRSAGSAGKGNVASAAREMYGENPLLKARNDLVYEAATRGVSVQYIMDERQRKAKYELGKEELAYNKEVSGQTAEFGYRTLNGVTVSRMAVRDSQIRSDAWQQLDKNPNMTDNQLKSYLAMARGEDEEWILSQMAAYEISAGFTFTEQHRSSLMQSTRLLYDRMERELLGLPTVEQRKTYLQTLNQMDQELTTRRLTDFAKGNGDAAMLIATRNPDTFAKFVDAAATSDAILKRLLGSKDSTDPNVQANIAELYLQQFPDNPLMQSMLGRWQRGELDDLLALVIGDVYEGKRTNVTFDPVVNEAKAIALGNYDMLSWDQRRDLTTNFITSLEFEDIKFSPTLVRDVRASAQATDLYIEKARQAAIPKLSVPGVDPPMVIDFADPNNPFQFKGLVLWEPGTRLPNDKESIERKDGLNQIYRTIRDNIGAPAAKKFLLSLETLGVKPKYLNVDKPAGPTSDRRPRAAGKESGQQAYEEQQAKKGPVITKDTKTGPVVDSKGELIDYKQTPEEGQALFGSMLMRNQEMFNVPEPLVHAIADTESTFGQDLVGPKNVRWGRARGTFHIIKAKFDEINARYYGGKLDWDNMEDASLAGLHLLFNIYRKHGNNWALIANEFHSGIPNPGKQSSDGLSTTEEYTQKVLQKINFWNQKLSQVPNGEEEEATGDNVTGNDNRDVTGGRGG